MKWIFNSWLHKRTPQCTRWYLSNAFLVPFFMWRAGVSWCPFDRRCSHCALPQRYRAAFIIDHIINPRPWRKWKWNLAQILDVINLARVLAVLAIVQFIAVSFVKRPTGPGTRKNAMAICARWGWPILKRWRNSTTTRTIIKHFAAVISHWRSCSRWKILPLKLFPK